MLGAECVAGVWLSRGEVWARAAARERATLVAAQAWLRERLPAVEPTEDEEVPVRFWTRGSGEGSAISRDLAVRDWPSIRDDYPAAVREQLDALMAYRPDAAAGQLLLWHGEPGTGKTTALRALAWEWRRWCRLHYVTDPEAFFGSAEYMLGALIDHEDWEDDERWRLLVLEDTGELLAPDAKTSVGQGLSRLLNVVDGLIGQGLRVLVLVTTNEPLQRLHPAVTRPGRCAAQIEFLRFPPEEVAAWLERQGQRSGEDGAAHASRSSTPATWHPRARPDRRSASAPGRYRRQPRPRGHDVRERPADVECMEHLSLLAPSRTPFRQRPVADRRCHATAALGLGKRPRVRVHGYCPRRVAWVDVGVEHSRNVCRERVGALSPATASPARANRIPSCISS